MRIKFFIRTSSKTNGKESTIRVRLNDGISTTLYAITQLTIPVKFWNNKAKANREKVRDMTEFLDRDWYKNKLDELEKHIRTEFQELKRDATSEWLNNTVDMFFKPEKYKPEPETLFGFIENYIKKSITRTNINTGKYISESTIKKYKTCYNLLKEFAGDGVLNFEDIDMQFYQEFTSFLAKGKNHAKNTIGKQIAVLKAFMNQAKESGLHDNTQYTRKKFKIVTEDTESVYLNEKELNCLHELDLSENKRLERVRDLFLIGAWTGCRFGDFTTITPDKIKNNTIHIEQEKTGHLVKIPLHPVVVEVLNKYDGKLPKPLTNQKFNEYIKEVCELADELKTPEKISQTKGGKRVTKTLPKYMLISSHTARRSFATNLYLSKFPTIGIMKMTGHKSEKTFLKYIKVSEDEHAAMLAEHWEKWERS
ncbi:MAG: site-specific integrase [Mariniphaga sp.]|nr:site-specific integrase [Mariniphaga sp.]